MPSFRRRPLTWLLLIATACVDLAMFARDAEAPWFGSLVDGQALALGGWAVLGRTHRLARAGFVEGMLLALAAADFVSRPHGVGTGPPVLAALATLTGLAAAGTESWRVLFDKLFGKRPRDADVRRETFQFPLVELFGWTIIVAVGATIGRLADFSVLREVPRGVFVAEAVAASFGIAAVSRVLHALENDRTIVSGAAIAICALATVLLMEPIVDGERPAFGSLLYAIAWVTIWASEARRDASAAADRDALAGDVQESQG